MDQSVTITFQPTMDVQLNNISEDDLATLLIKKMPNLFYKFELNDLYEEACYWGYEGESNENSIHEFLIELLNHDMISYQFSEHIVWELFEKEYHVYDQYSITYKIKE
jgi:hypothetical protein